MTRLLPLALALAGCVSSVAGDAPPDSPTPAPAIRRTVGYFASWDIYARDYHVADIPADQLDVINYAFANVTSGGDCVLADTTADPANLQQLAQLRASHPNLAVLLSVGGWTYSASFSAVAADPVLRAHFASSCAALIAQYGLDGLDVDWEYPGGGGMAAGSPADTQNYTLLLAAVRQQLGTKLLTVAAPAGANEIAHVDVASIAPIIDWANVMTYDFHGRWEMATNFDAPLAASAGDPSPGAAMMNVGAAVDLWLAAGLPAQKLVLGMPLYGYGWIGVAPTNDGLYQPATGLPPGSNAGEDGLFDYKDLAANYVPVMTRHWSADAQAPWLYDATRGLMISYDDAESLTAKADLVRTRGLGGAMFWELSSDDAPHTLVRAVRAELAK